MKQKECTCADVRPVDSDCPIHGLVATQKLTDGFSKSNKIVKKLSKMVFGSTLYEPDTKFLDEIATRAWEHGFVGITLQVGMYPPYVRTPVYPKIYKTDYIDIKIK